MEDETLPALPETMEITLDPPVSHNKTEYPRLILREPTLNQVQQAHAKLDDAALPSPGAMRDYMIAFVAGVSKLQPAVIEQLPVRVLSQAADYLETFVTCELPPGPEGLPDEFVVELDVPIMANGGEVSSLELREPRAGELSKAEALLGRTAAPLPGSVRRYQARLIQEVSGRSALVVQQLPFRKAREAIRYLEGFEKSAPATGKTSAAG